MSANSKNSIWKKLFKQDTRLSRFFMSAAVYIIVFGGLLLIVTAIVSFYHFVQGNPHL
ncbi:hypothetical protein [uncultured Methylophaga sp.]|jgi:hypothetical protein|uniref:hypothetical protein n=1 Tax=uncultured Methylophaga sp. TaxID=285271 RepID=UPI00261A7A87|nr:hypothetical protein [uncultured Methylophaga sp.]